MLTQISLQNFAIISQQDVDLNGGMTCITGETGAGKSILIDAIKLACGSKTDPSVVRHGTEKTSISACFDISNLEGAQQWLEEQELSIDNECIIRRVIDNKGKSRAWVNGTPVTLTHLKELSQQLIQIHGQHAFQKLLDKSQQLALLDEYGENKALLSQLAEQFKRHQQLKQTIQNIDEARAQWQARSDLLTFQTQELNELAMFDDEYTIISEEHKRLAHSEELNEGYHTATDILQNDEHAVLAQLAQLNHKLQSMLQYKPELNEVIELIDSASIQLSEANEQTLRLAAHTESNPLRLQQVDKRLAELTGMAKKHNVGADELHQHHQKLLNALEELNQDNHNLDALQNELDDAEVSYRKTALKLHKRRIASAQKIANNVTQAMQKLNMQGGQFEINVTHKKEAPLSKHGLDDIEMSISTNPGQPLKPLSKVASGGELSRIALLITMVTSESADYSTMVFDEVDSGIGGETGDVVGEYLSALGEHCQVLCVTHLGQVAAKAKKQLHVQKIKHSDITEVQISALSPAQRVKEVARMVAGAEVDESSLTLASKMLQRQAAIL